MNDGDKSHRRSRNRTPDAEPTRQYDDHPIVRALKAVANDEDAARAQSRAIAKRKWQLVKSTKLVDFLAKELRPFENAKHSGLQAFGYREGVGDMAAEHYVREPDAIAVTSAAVHVTLEPATGNILVFGTPVSHPQSRAKMNSELYKVGINSDAVKFENLSFERMHGGETPNGLRNDAIQWQLSAPGIVIDPSRIDFDKMIDVEVNRRAENANSKFKDAAAELGGATGSESIMDIKIEGPALDRIRQQVEKEFLGSPKNRQR